MANLTNYIYMDYAATTPVAREVVERMCEVLSGCNYGNPSSIHQYGANSARLITFTREEVSAELGCEPDEIVFTSGATEAINLALRGVALANAKHGKHLVTSAIEHKAVLEACASLQREGYEVTYISPNKGGWIEPRKIAEAIREDTLVVSIQHTNNETGVMQPISEIAYIAQDAGVLFHVDAAQAAGKFAIDLRELPVDLLSISAHKFYGPKGIGCLVVRGRGELPIQPLMYGGGQQHGLRPGTLATHQIVGLGAALALAGERREADLQHVTRLRKYFLERLDRNLPYHVHGDPDRSSPYIVNIAIDGIGSDALINQVSDDLAIASGSACSSGTIEPSHVLRAMGIEGELLYGAIRVSFGRLHTLEDMTDAVDSICAAVRRIHEIERQVHI